MDAIVGALLNHKSDNILNLFGAAPSVPLALTSRDALFKNEMMGFKGGGLTLKDDVCIDFFVNGNYYLGAFISVTIRLMSPFDSNSGIWFSHRLLIAEQEFGQCHWF